MQSWVVNSQVRWNQVYILYVELVVEFGLKTLSEFGFDLHGKFDLHFVVEQSKLKRVYDQGLLVEELDESHKDSRF